MLTLFSPIIILCFFGNDILVFAFDCGCPMPTEFESDPAFCNNTQRAKMSPCYETFFVAAKIQHNGRFPTADALRQDLKTLMQYCNEHNDLLKCLKAFPKACLTTDVYSLAGGRISTQDAVAFTVLHKLYQKFCAKNALPQSAVECLNADFDVVVGCLNEIIANDCGTLMGAINYCLATSADKCDNSEKFACDIGAIYFEVMKVDYPFLTDECSFECHFEARKAGNNEPPQFMRRYHENLLITVDDLDRAYLYFGWIPLVLAILGLIFSIAFAASAIPLMWKQRDSRQFYTLALNRTLGDIIACLVCLFAVYYWLRYVDMAEAKRYQVESIDAPESFEIVKKVEMFVIASFWTAMVACSALSFLKFFAVVRPLHYKNINFRRCIWFIVISWVIAALMSVSDWYAHWRLVRVSYIAITYFLPLVCFLLSVLLIKQGQKHSAQVQRPPYALGENESAVATTISRFPLWKLGISVTIFTVFSSFYTVFFAWLTLYEYSRHRNAMFRLWYLARNAFLIRIILDCICGFAFDPALRRSFMQWTRLGKLGSTGSATTFSTNISRSSAGHANLTSDSEKDTEPAEPAAPFRESTQRGRSSMISFFTNYGSSMNNSVISTVPEFENEAEPKAAIARHKSAAHRECEKRRVSVCNLQSSTSDNLQSRNGYNDAPLSLTLPTACTAVFILDTMCDKSGEPVSFDTAFNDELRLHKYFSSADDMRRFLPQIPHLYQVNNGIQFERRDQRTRDLFEQLNATLVGKLPTSLLLGRIKACDEHYLSDKYGQVGNEKAIEKFLVDYGALFEVHESELLTAKQKIVEFKKPMLLARKIRQWSVQGHERQLVD